MMAKCGLDVLAMGLDEEKTSLTLSPPDFTPSQDIWYKDGSVILVTEKTGFKVHTSILATNCEVFRDMANIPQPSGEDDTAETYDHCVVIRLGDTTVDMKHFLHALYDFRWVVRITHRQSFADRS